MHLTFLTRWIKYLTSQEAGERGAFAGYTLGECNMVVVFCKRLTRLLEVLHFIKKMNEPVMVIWTTLFTRCYNYRVVHVLTAFLESVVHILLKLIYFCDHFLTVNSVAT